MLALRPYQTDLISATREALRAHQSVLIQLPTGGGKTAIATQMMQTVASRGRLGAFICHRQELVDQTMRTFEEFSVPYGVISAGYTPNPLQPIQICSIDTLRARLKSERRIPKFDLLMWDECFPAGTLVDGAPIENITCSNMVRSYNHRIGAMEMRRVVRVFRSVPKALCVVKTTRGNFVCTPGHPFFVDGIGYVQAGYLWSGAPLFSVSDVQCAGENYDKVSKKQNEKTWLGVLRDRLFDGIPAKSVVRDDDKNKFAGCGASQRAHDKSQPHAEEMQPRKDAGYSETDWTYAASPGRKWHWVNEAAKEDAGFPEAIRSGGRVCGADFERSRARVSDALQIGYCDIAKDACDRSGRRKSWGFGSQDARSQEGCLSHKTRVESVEIVQPSDTRRFRELLPDGHVYNIEVEGNHNYFVNDTLVHNCHHIAAGGWTAVKQYFSTAKHVGLTATPERLDGKGLSPAFMAMVQGPTTSQLIDGGYLVPYRAFAPSTPDLGGVHTKMGDFVRGENEAVMDRPSITGDAVGHYLKLARGKRGLAFCVSVKHSQHVAQQFRDAGIVAWHLDGDTDRGERRQAVAAFRRGEIKVLCNVDLFGEGFDVPSADASIMLRPTKSLALYLQQCGRVLRPSEGKPHALLLDHAGNIARHGLPDDDREWTLEGRQGRKRAADDSAPPVRQCPKCYACHRPAPVCPQCGWNYELKAREVDHVDGDLAEIDIAEQRRMRLREQSEAVTIEGLIALGRQRGYKSPEKWAAHLWTARIAKRSQNTA